MGKRKTIVIVAEGAHDSNLQKISTTQVKEMLASNLKLDTRVTTLGHVQRGGPPCAFDRVISTLLGAEAVNAVLDCQPDMPSPMIGIIENKIVRKPLMEAVRLTKQVSQAVSNKDFKYAMSLRNAEFAEYQAAYMITAAADKPELKLPTEKVCVGRIMLSRIN